MLQLLKEYKRGVEFFLNTTDNPIIQKINQLINSGNIQKYEPTILQEIVEKEDKDALLYFCNKGLDINIRTKLANNPVLHVKTSVSINFFNEMLDLGYNFLARNTNGETLLLSLARKQVNSDLQFRLLELGVNPYIKDFASRDCFSYADETNMSQTIEFYSQFQPEAVLPFERLLSEFGPEIALNRVQSTIYNVGGLNKVFDYITDPVYYKLIYDLQVSLCYLGRTEEANGVIKMFLSKRNGQFIERMGTSFILAASFVEKDSDTLFDYVDYLLANPNTRQNHYENALLQGYFFATIMEDNTRMKNYLSLTKRKIGKNRFTSLIKDTLLAKDEVARLICEELLEELRNNFISVHYSELEFLQGMYYFAKGDLITAELRFRRNLEYSLNNQIVHYKEYPASLLLTKYLSEFQGTM